MASLPSRLPPLTPQELEEDAQSNILACNITVVVLATVAVAVRFWARRIGPDGYRLDDSLIAAALVVGWGLVGATIAATNNGLGQHWRAVLAAGESSVITEGQAYLASGILFVVAIALVKISALLLYTRIFGNRQSLLVAAWVIGMFTIVWSAVVVVVSCLQCRPIAALWDPSIQGTCINGWSFFVVTSALNTITDLVVLVLPVPAILGLQLQKFERCSLAAVFLIGTITCVVSILRLVSLISAQNNADTTWTQGMVAMWTAAEPCLGIVAVSLPTLSPFFFRSVGEPMNPSLNLLPEARSESAASSRRFRPSFDWANIELVKPSKWMREDPYPEPREGVIEVRTTWETRHSYRKMSG